MNNNSEWVNDEFVSSNIGDVRLNERLKIVAKSFMEKPQISILAVSNSWVEAKGMYRFFSNAKVKVEKILKPHTESTMKRLKGLQIVLAPCDSTDIIYNKNRDIENLGPVSNNFFGGLLPIKHQQLQLIYLILEFR